MSLEIVVTPIGGSKVNATVEGFTIPTDQSPDSGGEGSAPEPFAYFLSSLATCAGIYVVRFCQGRGIPTEGIRLVQDHAFDEKTGKLLRVGLRIEVPAGFPAKYHAALARTAALCTVKRTIENPPEFEISTVADPGPG